MCGTGERKEVSSTVAVWVALPITEAPGWVRAASVALSDRLPVAAFLAGSSF